MDDLVQVGLDVPFERDLVKQSAMRFLPSPNIANQVKLSQQDLVGSQPFRQADF